MLLAAIKYAYVNKTISSTSKISLESLNKFFSEVETILNSYVSIINKKGISMENISLIKVKNINELIDVYNANIAAINDFIANLENSLDTMMLSEDDLRAKNIKFINDTMSGSISIEDDAVKINWTSNANNHSLIINGEDIIQET